MRKKCTKGLTSTTGAKLRHIKSLMQPFQSLPIHKHESFHLENELAQIEVLLREHLPSWQCAQLKNRHMELCRALEEISRIAA